MNKLTIIGNLTRDPELRLNTGYFWPKNAFFKNPGTLTIEFLPPMPKGLDKREFIKELQDRIEEACARLPMK